MSFPNRVWEPTGKDEKGKTLWSSRIPTAADIKRRNKFTKEQTLRIVTKMLRDMK